MNLLGVVVSMRQRAKDRSGNPDDFIGIVVNSLVAPDSYRDASHSHAP
ncbi:MAG: hypothetical protein ACK5RG_01245 [Cyclobacteriaceae bacterium]|nr:hypothetical protein [Flammeovirgaceae bacterium]